MAKKGPGRPTGGIKIEPSHNIPISDKLFLDALKEILDVSAYNNLLKLPEQSRQILIGDIKSRLFNVAGETKADPAAIYLGEYGDMRGVQVTFNLEMFYKDPVGYLKKLPKSYLEGIIRQNDVEAEVEMKTVQELLSTGDTIKSKSYFQQKGNHVQMTQDGIVNIPRVGPKVVKGAEGIDGIPVYKDYADSVVKWVDSVQSIGGREKGKAGVRGNLSKVFVTELLLNSDIHVGDIDPRTGRGLDEDDVVQRIISRVPAGSTVRKAYESFVDTPKFKELYQKEIAKSATGSVLNIENLLTQVDPRYRVAPPVNVPRVLNAYTLSNKLNRLSTFTGDLKTYILNEVAPNDAVAASWGFTSAAAVQKMLDSYFADPSLKIGVMGDVSSDPLFTKLFKTKSTDVFKSEDVRRFESILKDLNKTIGDIQGELTDTFMANSRYGGYKIVEDIVAGLPPSVTVVERDTIKSRMKGAVNWMTYVEVRSDMEAQEEFFTAVGKGAVWKAYFYKGKYNQFMPKSIQQISDRILARPIPGFGRSVNTYLDLVVQKRDAALGLLGFSGKDTASRRLLSVNKSFVLRQSDFNSKFWATTKGKPFIWKDVRPMLSPGPNSQFTFNSLFKDNITWDKLGNKSDVFRKNFFNFNTASITINASNYEMLPDFFTSVYEIVKNTPGITDDVVNNLFLMAARNPGLLDVAPEFASLRASANFAKYKDSILKFFKQAKAQGIPEEEYFSFALLLKQKGLVADGAVPGTFSLVRYTPLLNTIANKLSNIQTYIYEFVGEKVLANRLLTAPVFGKGFEWLWGKYNPRYGGLGMAESFIQFTKKTLLGRSWNFVANSGFGKLVWAGLSRILPAFLTSATAGTAYLAIAINKVMLAIGKSFMHILKGRFNMIGKEFYYILDDLVVKPIKFIMNVGSKIVIYTLVVVALMVSAASAFLIQTLSPKIPDGTGGPLNNPDYYTNINGQICAKFASSSLVSPDFRNIVDGGFYSKYNVSDCPGVDRSYTDENGNLVPSTHKGMDYPMNLGTGVYNNLTEEAEVVVAGWNSQGFGNLVVIKKEVGGVPYYIYFGHLYSIDVSVGDTVKSGQLLGQSGSTGNSTGPHLHYEVRVGSRGQNAAVNPCTVLACPDKCLNNTQTMDGEVCVDPLK